MIGSFPRDIFLQILTYKQETKASKAYVENPKYDALEQRHGDCKKVRVFSWYLVYLLLTETSFLSCNS